MAPRKRLAIHIVTLLLLLPGAALPAPTNLYVFGDSLLDSGNAYAITGNVYPISPPYDQRFSNGPVASEVLASNLGVTAIASQLGGTNYATGGATSGIYNFAGIVFGGLILPSPPFTSPPNQIALLSLSDTGGVTQQVGLFTSAPPADIGSSLVLVWAGPNDLFLTSAAVEDGLLPPIQSTFTQAAETAATNVEDAIRSLTAAGAKNILAVNLPDLGQIPAANNPLGPFWSGYTTEFNSQFLDPTFLATLDPSVRLTEFSMFDLFNNVMSDPSAYGFTNVTDACLPTLGPVPIGPACADPNQYLFWDEAHPTAAANRVIGNLFYAAIPEPPSIGLLIAPLVLLIARRKVS